MTTQTILSPASLLAELHRLGIRAEARGDNLSLRPASCIPPALLDNIRGAKVEILSLLADPRYRWRTQAEVIFDQIEDVDLRQDLVDVFEEREAIASVDGHLDDDAAGQTAYEHLVTELANRTSKGECL